MDMSHASGGTRTYRVVLSGELGDRFETLFDGMELSRQGGTTVLVGAMQDQAHLAGVLERVHELGLDLISVNLEDPAGGDT